MKIILTASAFGIVLFLTAVYFILEEFSRDKIIYGINTGFGPMVQFKIEPQDLNNLQGL